MATAFEINIINTAIYYTKKAVKVYSNEEMSVFVSFD